MLESARDIGEEFVKRFRRTYLNQGYVEYLINRDKEVGENVERQLTNMVGRLAVDRQEKLLTIAEDEDLILGDELHELQRGRLDVSFEKIDNDI